MKTLRIIAGYYVDELAEAECEQTALDKVIDAYEFMNYSACFCDSENTNEDEYVIGGNHYNE